ncbi:hypothetical protein HF521_002647 [Silurus meridionalis]|uniref:Sarcolipin n=1 Tax=Silurus meridionalis TaxID=175797 RepID=A0A8T0B395_SILME|nr:hypothetical protein HF521_002647 [Silurus meridionalis]
MTNSILLLHHRNVNVSAARCFDSVLSVTPCGGATGDWADGGQTGGIFPLYIVVAAPAAPAPRHAGHRHAGHRHRHAATPATERVECRVCEQSQPLLTVTPPCLGEMDRSVQELFLNFMIVLITVLLMWLLVRSYQEA